MARKLAGSGEFEREDYEDLVQTGILSLMVATERYREQGKEVKSLPDWAWCVLRRAMQDVYLYTKSKALSSRGRTDLDEALFFVFEGEDELFEKTMVAEFRNELGRLYGQRAVQVLDNLLAPSHSIYHVAEAEYARRAAAKAPGEAMKGVKGVFRITKEHIRVGLGMTYGEWDETLRRIKQLARQWYPRAVLE